MKLLAPELWLRQAKADAAASRVKGQLAECHRRYLLQQAYEKGVKALALACLTKKQGNKKQFASALGDCFLHHHTPFTVFSTKVDAEWAEELRQAYGRDWETLLKGLKVLRTEVAKRRQNGADAKTIAAWKKIDGTRPIKAVNAVSYRYPFVDPAQKFPEGVSPADWSDWNSYQGVDVVARGAVAELLERAGRQVAIWHKS